MGASATSARAEPPPKASRARGGDGAGVLHEPGAGPAGGQVGHRDLAPDVGGKGDAADPARGGHHERLAEGAVGARVAHGHVAARGPLARRHRLPAREEVVEPAGAREPCLVRGLQRRHARPQERLGVAEREVLLEPVGRNARPAAEHALEVRGRHAARGRERPERDRPAAGRVDGGDCAGHHAVVVGVGRLRLRGVEGWDLRGRGLGMGRAVHGRLLASSQGKVGRPRPPTRPASCANAPIARDRRAPAAGPTHETMPRSLGCWKRMSWGQVLPFTTHHGFGERLFCASERSEGLSCVSPSPSPGREAGRRACRSTGSGRGLSVLRLPVSGARPRRGRTLLCGNLEAPSGARGLGSPPPPRALAARTARGA